MDIRRHVYSVFNAKSIPHCQGVYVFYDDDWNPLYVGVTNDLRRRIHSHLSNNSNTRAYTHLFAFVECFLDLNIIHEEEIMKSLNPVFNISSLLNGTTNRVRREELLDAVKDMEKLIRDRKILHLQNEWF
ncbi:GIY-YIG nuclease family protein [Rossellomorea sp. NPDC071047]|uniref:GIY-YIG nuclease family protein n=1 Tax=Rossellomorea sp. NPDC071047 TaxID=3390675 RepID=UPI003D066B05